MIISSYFHSITIGTGGAQFHLVVLESDKLVMYSLAAKRAMLLENKDGESITVQGIGMRRFSLSPDFLMVSALM